MERTFIMVKPDGVQRGLIGEIVSRLEQKGLQLTAAKLVQMSRQQAEKHYEEHAGRDYYEPLLTFVTSGPVFAMVWEGNQAVQLSRILIGKTNPLDALPGTIRGDFAAHTRFNLIHGSDSPENAERELANFFSPSELVKYESPLQAWIYG